LPASYIGRVIKRAGMDACVMMRAKDDDQGAWIGLDLFSQSSAVREGQLAKVSVESSRGKAPVYKFRVRAVARITHTNTVDIPADQAAAPND
jgi:hypothetical protein